MKNDTHTRHFIKNIKFKIINTALRTKVWSKTMKNNVTVQLFINHNENYGGYIVVIPLKI